MANAFGPKPLVDVNLTSEFGGIEDLETFKADGVAQHDYSYVPKFSEKRVERDLALAKLARGEIKAKDVPVLDGNCRWYRTVKGAGSDPDMMRAAKARNEGYRAMTKADIDSGLIGMPPGAVLAPDGTIKSAGGDLQLFYAPQQAAAKNALRKKILTEQQVDGIQYDQEGLKAVGGRVKGADPHITKETPK